MRLISPEIKSVARAVVLLSVNLVLLAGCGGEPPTAAPQTVFINGRILTMDDRDTVVEALAVQGDSILATGTSLEVSRLAGPDSRIVDLGGRTMTPGLIDVHNHFAWGALGENYGLILDYPRVESIADIVAAVESRVAEVEPGDWITGSNWDGGKLSDGRDPTAADLDSVSPDNPVWLLHTSAHYGIANSRALELANITSDTRDPGGGVIGRDEDGQPTGMLADQAMALVTYLTPDVTADDFDAAITQAVGSLNAEGITTIKDPEIGQRQWDAYNRVHERGELSVRVFTLWGRPNSMEEAEELLEHIAPFTNPRQDTGDDHVISGGVKIYVDGSGTARTAWMHDEWNIDFDDIDEDNFGLTYLDPDVLMAQIRIFHNAGIHLGVHAIGDRAIDFTMDAYETVLRENPIHGLRHSIIHCNLPTEHAMDLMVKLQMEFDAAYPEIQPAFLWWIGDQYAANFGPERSLRVLPMRTFLERGIRWAGSSDFDVSPFAPRYALWAAVERESIGVMDALKAYTRGSARQVFLEEKIGSIEVGKYADLVVWDRDPLSIDAPELKDLRVLLTMMDGDIVYGDPATW